MIEMLDNKKYALLEYTKEQVEVDGLPSVKDATTVATAKAGFPLDYIGVLMDKATGSVLYVFQPIED